MPSSLLTPLFTWLYISCVMIMMKTQLLSAAQGNCKDVWPNCHDYTTYCVKNALVKKNCKKSCELCPGTGSGSKSQGAPSAHPQTNAVLNKGSQTAPSDSCKDIWPESKCLETTDNCGWRNKHNCLKTCYLCGGDSTGKIGFQEASWLKCKNEAGDKYCKKTGMSDCTINSSWRCKLMCGVCSLVKPKFPPGLNTCKDTLPDCDKRKKYCRKYSDMIRNRCWKTCGFCVSTSDCKDNWKACATIKPSGRLYLCRKEDVMKNCPVTCNLC